MRLRAQGLGLVSRFEMFQGFRASGSGCRDERTRGLALPISSVFAVYGLRLRLRAQGFEGFQTGGSKPQAPSPKPQSEEP